MPHGRGLSEGPFCDQLFPRHLHEFYCDVSGFLCGGDHMDLLVHKLPGYFLGKAVLSHRQLMI